MLPRLDEPLLQTCATSGISHETCDARNVNDAAIADIIRSIQPRVVIYSGFGGQIVGKPSSRSTTVPAYALRGYTNVPRQHDAVLCAPERRPPDSDGTVPDPRIDTGPIVARRTYPKPPAGADIDHQYDSAIRADLLLRVMRTRLLANGMIDAQPQPQVEDPPYYVIHPVLKHLAVLSLESRPDHA